MAMAVGWMGPCQARAKASSRSNWFLTAGVLLAAAALAGCIEADYPGRWPAVTPAPADCPSIVGRYVNEGERGESDNSRLPPPHLTGFLMPGMSVSEDASIDTVAIHEPQAGVLEIVAERGGQVVSSRRLNVGLEYECVDGCIETSSEKWANEQATGKQWDSDAYCRAADGSLIVKSTSSGVGVILLVIPVGGSESNWFRFRSRGYP